MALPEGDWDQVEVPLAVVVLDLHGEVLLHHFSPVKPKAPGGPLQVQDRTMQLLDHVLCSIF